MEKQTAVEWLVEKMLNQDWYTYKSLEYIEQAKKMEKQQIIDAYETAMETSEEKQIKSLKEQLKLSQNISDEMVKKIQYLINMYNAEISKLEKEFKYSSSLLTLRELSTLKSVVMNLENKLNKY
jgi:nitrate/TMAO reductase-like tetraheme cytochrome c subunit